MEGAIGLVVVGCGVGMGSGGVGGFFWPGEGAAKGLLPLLRSR